MFRSKSLGGGFESLETRAAPSGLHGWGDWEDDDDDITVADVVTFRNPDGSPAAGDKKGTAALERHDHKITMKIETELLAGAYTVWWVVFNNPEECSDTCGGDDLPPNGGDPAVEASVLYATGGIVEDDGDGNGVGRFKAKLKENKIPKNAEVFFGDGLLDAEGAEIHFIIRFHGPDTGDPSLTTTFNGGCDDPITPADEGFPCYDAQAGNFREGGGDDDDDDDDDDDHDDD